MKEVIIMLEQIISSHQLAANIKNKVRYTPTKETSGHAGFINAINKSIDDYIFEDDKYMIEGNKPSAKDPICKRPKATAFSQNRHNFFSSWNI